MGNVAIVLTPEFADWEYALLAGTGGPFYGLDIRFFAPEPGDICSQGGLVAKVCHTLDEIPQWSPTAIAVIGGNIWATDNAPDVSDLLTTHHANGGVVAGICGGTLALARSGLLNETIHTSNDADFLINNAPDYSGTDYFSICHKAVIEDRVITAPGTAPVSFTAAIFDNVGLDDVVVKQFRMMMAAEHGKL